MGREGGRGIRSVSEGVRRERVGRGGRGRGIRSVSECVRREWEGKEEGGGYEVLVSV